jgi:hypothetical protein
VKCKPWAIVTSLTRALSVAALLGVVGCASSLPAPPAAKHPLSAYREVPYPPPAALAETVPERPARDGLVWVDGEWVFHGDVFVWRRGGWVAPPQAARFAPWQAFYRRDGRLMLAPGTWYNAQNERLRRPEPVTPAYTPPNEITSELQTGR